LTTSTRDVRIDFMRGLAMTLVIVNHSRLPSLFSWFSYERFWVVTAAEVFVVLSGIVIGIVYGRKLAKLGWGAVGHGLGQRAALLYLTFVGVTVSVIALAALGVDVKSLAAPDGSSPAWFVSPDTMNAAAWRDVLLMRVGPWAFEIIGLYVWLVVAALPCLFILRYAGWRPLLAASWVLYLWYRVDPHPVTMADFETTFPILSWQLLFVHGVAIGYHRNAVAAFATRLSPFTRRVAIASTVGFAVFAFCNPWANGPAWLRLPLLSDEGFAYVYGNYFKLSELGAGRLLNLAVALPFGIAALDHFSVVAQPFARVFVTLGQRSLGAFVLHTYGLLLLAQLPMPEGIVPATLVQLTFVLAVAVLLNARNFVRDRRREPELAPARPLAA
jgi:hypothetical protein